MDINNLFSFFLEGDEEGEEIIITDDLTITPQYWLGMFKKLILNHLVFNKQAVKMFSKSNKEFDISEIEEAGGHITYHRAWFYISKIDLKNENHLIEIKEYSDEYLEKTLKLAIKYFQNEGESEDYMKCAHLLKILKKI
jgi:hypothetical protein|tara:strand:+ start:587 stop:1003 length:417 start_codon:yes stop_codon:yes gene_type:complete